MDRILLLGQIPGTTIQINFLSWLVAALLIVAYGMVRYDRAHDHLPALYVKLWRRYAWLLVKVRYYPLLRARVGQLIRHTIVTLRSGIAAAWLAFRQWRAAANETQM